MSPPNAALLCVFFATAVLPGAPAQATDVEPIRQAIAEFLRTQTKNLPGPATFSIGAIQASGLRGGCRDVAVTMDTTAPAWGRTHVNARCTQGATWSIYVSVQIHVSVDYLISAHALRSGQVISEADIGRRRGDLAALPTGILTDPVQALGQTTITSLPADRPLRAQMLRQPLAIKQGQSVKAISTGIGFQASTEGSALNNAIAGQVVQVRLASGQVIKGVARSDGTVEIAN